jgi:hypothetical protein
LGDLGLDKDNIKMDPRDMGCEGVDLTGESFCETDKFADDGRLFD